MSESPPILLRGRLFQNTDKLRVVYDTVECAINEARYSWGECIAAFENTDHDLVCATMRDARPKDSKLECEILQQNRCRLFKIGEPNLPLEPAGAHTEVWDTAHNPFRGEMPDGELVKTFEGLDDKDVRRQATEFESSIGVTAAGSWCDTATM